MIQRGELTAEEVRGHAVSSRLTRFVGMEPPAAADSYVCEVAPGDVIVLCTDGLYAMVSDDELRVAVAQTEDLQDLVERLVAKANETGGKDNISVVCIKII